MKPQRREVTQRRGWTRDSNRCRARCLCRSTNHNSTNSFLQQNGIEIDYQSKLPTTESQLAKESGFVYRLNRGHGACTDRDASSNEQFKFISRFKRHTLIAECNRTFALEHNSAQVQFVAQAHFTRGGKQSRTKSPMDFQCGCNDFGSQLLSFGISTVGRGTKCGSVCQVCDGRNGRSKCEAGFAIVKAKYEPFDAVFKYSDVKIKKQTDRPSAKFKVRESLRAVNRMNSFNSLCFDHNCIINESIEAIAAIQFNPFVNYRKGPLRLMRNTAKGKLASQRCLIGSFDFSGAKFAMNFDRGTNNLMSKFVGFHRSEIRCSKEASK
jgi:hypothetical protein